MQMELIFEQKNWQGLALKNSPFYSFSGYVNNNFAQDFEDWKLVICYCYFSNKAVLSCYSKIEKIVSTSTINAEYIGLDHKQKKAMWI